MRGQQVAPFEPLAVDGEPAANLVDLVHRSVLAQPDHVALRWKPARSRRQSAEGDAGQPIPWRTSTYRETWDWIRDVSLGLQSVGVSRGDSVCIVCRTRPEWLVVDLASMALGADLVVQVHFSSQPVGPAFPTFAVRLGRRPEVLPSDWRRVHVAAYALWTRRSRMASAIVGSPR